MFPRHSRWRRFVDDKLFPLLRVVFGSAQGDFRRNDLLVPALIYGATFLLSLTAFHFRMRVPWDWFQLLDRTDLENHPFSSLLLLHGQPPLLNTVVATALQFEKYLGLPAEWTFEVLFRGLGLMGSILLYRLVVEATRNRIIGGLVLVSVLFEPGYLFFHNLVFYAFLEFTFVILILWFVWRFLNDGPFASYVRCAVSLLLMTLTRVLFHPLWALATLALLPILRPRGARVPNGARPYLVILAATACALSLWPLKNLVVFGQFTYSTWTGYNLTRVLPSVAQDIERFWRDGVVPAGLENYPLPGWIGPAGRQQLLKPRKESGESSDFKASNWNHVIFLAENPRLTKIGIRWRTEHPGEWWSLVPYYYSCYTHSPVLQPYSRALFGPKQGAFPSYARWYLGWFYPDVYPALGATFGWPNQDGRREPQSLYARHHSLTLYGAVWYPLALLYALVHAARMLRGRAQRLSPFVAFCGWILVYHLFASVLSDGEEGMRFRFATTPVTQTLLGLLAAGVWERLRSRSTPAARPVRR